MTEKCKIKMQPNAAGRMQERKIGGGKKTKGRKRKRVQDETKRDKEAK